MRERLLRFLGLGAMLAALLAGPTFSQSVGGTCGTGGLCQPGYLCCPGGCHGCMTCVEPLPDGKCPPLP
jgi:hypothetical protein